MALRNLWVKVFFLSQKDIDIAQRLMNSKNPKHQALVRKINQLTLYEVQQNGDEKIYHELFADTEAFEYIQSSPELKLAYVLAIYANTRLKDALTDVYYPDQNQLDKIIEIIQTN